MRFKNLGSTQGVLGIVFFFEIIRRPKVNSVMRLVGAR